MTRKTLILTPITVGLVVAATSDAFNFKPSAWSARYTPAALSLAPPPVVGVTVAGLHKAGPDEFALDPNDPFFQFFRGLPGFQFRPPRPGRGGDVPFRSEGSGFIISSDGLILTHTHVVREAKEVIVKLSDRREFKAKVLGADPATDIAVLRIDAKNLPVVRLGDAQQLQVGDPGAWPLARRSASSRRPPRAL